IRAVVLSSVARGWEVVGSKRGYASLLGEDDLVPLTPNSVRGIGHLGGTILGANNRSNPFRYPQRLADGTISEVDRSDLLIASVRDFEIDAIIAIGGDGSLTIAQKLHEKGLRVIGVPKTIDNDVNG